MRLSKGLFLGCVLALGLGATACGDDEPDAPSCTVGSQQYRTDLFFGRDRVGDVPVSEAEFQGFVDTVITPRFKDGLTLYDANGQYQMEDGTLVHELSKIIVLLHDGSAARSADIDYVREEYKRQFNQEAVLRIDSTPCVAF
ncbi:DUF3574 domain-containing protein [Corallococcus terminator]|uniref:DUF3574 domain-containing protein n=1 Tax=Corallococcus terminator TaxID=2316733 RepID=A0A3A8IP41_9BACT|nr:DUF3574 domain-containing protein [Corallococcus terminator]RKG85207.1 DUF3574 domain-containing protein [Corallococcus terminator]